MRKLHNHKRLKKRTLTVGKSTKPRLIDRATYAAAVIEPIVTIPQAATLFIHKNAAGISLSSWIGYELLTIVWMWYGVVHKDKLILTYQGLFFIVQTFVIAGGLMYGAKW
jgi:uncharacterized protein with PQ loop repeat